MEEHVLGVHHVTAITSDAQRNIEFYSGLLGLRLVKLTVNFDDPTAYHLYYGDTLGRPGTILTFFAWPGAPRGRQGTGQVAITSLAIPRPALDYWTERLTEHGVAHGQPVARFGEVALALRDPDGLALELVAADGAEARTGWEGGPVPNAYSIRGVHSVTVWEDGPVATERLLTQTLGFHKIGTDGTTARYAVGAGEPGTVLDVREAPGSEHGRVAVGTVHHVAWRTASDEEQLSWRERIAAAGPMVTPVQDRQYFNSIYFREPGGVLFEIATDPPGFAIDEPVERLGGVLKLPPWLEPHRAVLEQALPRLTLPPVMVGS
jgi:catechol 2,3-dioxygenase-like lactoylglutathione lyase family enzyme